LKEKHENNINSERTVSNPWREAIEVRHHNVGQSGSRWFPILGGRLLKAAANKFFKASAVVSNPWREAIEA